MNSLTVPFQEISFCFSDEKENTFLNYKKSNAMDFQHWGFIFLGGLSLHLNHLIGSRVTNYDWPFGTLPFRLFGSNLDTRDLETYARIYSGHFWNMSICDDSRAIWVLFRKWVVSENQSFLNEGVIVISLVLGGEVPRLNHGPICCPIQKLKGVLRAIESRVPLFWHFHEGLKHTYYWCIASRISP